MRIKTSSRPLLPEVRREVAPARDACPCGVERVPTPVSAALTLPLCPRCPVPASVWKETGRCPQCLGKGDIHRPGCPDPAACKQFLERTPRDVDDPDYWCDGVTCYMQLCPACDGTGRRHGIRRPTGT